MTAARGLSPRAIATLDAVRGGAAVYVVLHHLSVAMNLPIWIRAPLLFGPEAVIVFFLLSGFLIFHHERDRPDGIAGYALRRALRLYPMLIVAMIVSALVMLAHGWLWARFSWRGLFGTLFGLQDVAWLKPGVIVGTFLGNLPLWSLSYEMAFYAMFPAVLVAWKRWPAATNHLVGLASILAYASYVAWPNHWSLVTAYFGLWWAGAVAAQAHAAGRLTLRGMAAALFWLVALAVAAAVVVLIVPDKGPGLYPMLMLRHFGVAPLILIVAVSPLARRLGDLALSAAAPAAWLASISYGLYVVHFPLVDRAGAALMPLAIAVSVLIAWAGDRRLNRFIASRLRRHRPERQAGTRPIPEAVETPNEKA